MLRLHPKTVLRHIRAGRLPAAKAGGRWRVREEDLGAFVGGRREVPLRGVAGEVLRLVRGDAAPPPEGALQACVIVAYNPREPDQAAALAEVFLRAMNTPDPDRGVARFQSMYEGDEPYGRYVLWGRPGFLARVLAEVEATGAAARR